MKTPHEARRRLALALATAAGFLLAAPAWGQPGGPPHRRPHHGPPMEHALEQVELPDEVRSDVDALLDASRKSRREIHRELRKAHEKMRALLDAESPDEDAILAQADEIGRLEVTAEKDRLRTLLRIRERLSPEQREAMTRVLEEMKSKRGRHRGPPKPR